MDERVEMKRKSKRYLHLQEMCETYRMETEMDLKESIPWLPEEIIELICGLVCKAYMEGGDAIMELDRRRVQKYNKAHKQWYDKNREEMREYMRRYQRLRYRTDDRYRQRRLEEAKRYRERRKERE